MTICEIHNLATNLMKEHGLVEKGWILKWDNAKNRAGQCGIKRGIKYISLSKVVLPLHTDKSIKDTILHEIAHALAGIHNGHNHVWKRVALQIGCNAQRCYDDSSFKQGAKEALIAQSKYTLTCPNCGKKRPAHRKHKRISACGECCKKYNGGKYDEKFKWIVIQNY